MAGEWTEATVGEAFEVNPPRALKRGLVAPFIPMDALPVHARAVERIDYREFAGSGTRFKNGDTLIARITPCLENGKTVFVAELPDGAVGHGSTEYIVLAGKEKLSDGLYGYYLARSPDFRRYAIGHMEGTSGRQRVPSTAVEKYVVGLPPLPEQRAIAHILGTLDDKIELNRRMSETLETMARALFKAWFVDFEPVRAKIEGRWQRGQSLPGLLAHLYDIFPDRLVDSELGEIPEGWEVGRHSDVVEQLRDPENPLSSPDVLFQHFSIPAFDEGQNPKPEYGQSIKSLKSRVPAGTTLLSKLNPEIERVWLVDVRPGERAVCSTEFLVLHARPPFTRSFVYCFARSILFRQQIEGLVTGTSKSHQRAQVDSILNLAVVMPSSPIVAAFDRSADSLLARTLKCRRESRTLAALRDTLLPKLISGEIRVHQAESLIDGELG